MASKAQPRPNTRRPYRDRWVEFDDETRQRVAGDHAGEVDALLEEIDSLEDADRLEIIETLSAHAAGLTARIEATKSHLERMLVERTAVWAKLAVSGEQQSLIARRSDVSDQAVAFAIGVSTRTR